MTVYDKWKAGELQWHIDQGIIRSAVITYCRISEQYQEYRNHGHNYIAAVELTAEHMHTSVDTVKRAIAEVL
jgi:hypothetical protein